MPDPSRVSKSFFIKTKNKIACLIKRVLLGKYLIQKRIGTDSINGEVFRACNLSVHKTCLNVFAVKKIPVDNDIMKMHKDPFSVSSLQLEVWAELLCLSLCNKLVEQDICPNLPVYYTFTVCGDCEYESLALKKKLEYKGQKTSPCMFIVNEFATGGDIKHWIKSAPRDISSWYSAYFQIFAGLYALQKYFDLTHHDLHWGNVLVHNVKPGGYWEYLIDGVKYHVPNTGFMFVLWDFGYARIPNLLEIKKLVDYNYYTDSSQNPRYLCDYRQTLGLKFSAITAEKVPENYFPKELDNFIQKMIKNVSLGKTLNQIFPQFTSILPVQSIRSKKLASYNLDKAVKLPRELKRFARTKNTVLPVLKEKNLLQVKKSTSKSMSGVVYGDLPTPEMHIIKDTVMLSNSPKKTVIRPTFKVNNINPGIPDLKNLKPKITRYLVYDTHDNLIPTPIYNPKPVTKKSIRKKPPAPVKTFTKFKF